MSAPWEKIWLQEGDGEEPPVWIEGEVTWSALPIGKHCAAYIRADLYREAVEALKASEQMLSPGFNPHTLRKVRAAIAKSEGLA